MRPCPLRGWVVNQLEQMTWNRHAGTDRACVSVVDSRSYESGRRDRLSDDFRIRSWDCVILLTQQPLGSQNKRTGLGRKNGSSDNVNIAFGTMRISASRLSQAGPSLGIIDRGLRHHVGQAEALRHRVVAVGISCSELVAALKCAAFVVIQGRPLRIGQACISEEFIGAIQSLGSANTLSTQHFSGVNVREPPSCGDSALLASSAA